MLLFVKNLIFTLLVPGTVAVVVPLCVFSHPENVASIGAVFGAVSLVAGVSTYAWCLWDFMVTGHGTPAPIDPPKTLVVRGLYRWSRNPMYLGVLGVIAGWALLFRSLALTVYAACVALAFHLFVLLYEEPHLERTFGADYRAYCRRVRRWCPWPHRHAA